MASKYKAILFDMDGVIVDTMPYHFLAWKKIFASIGITVDTFEIYKREGEKGMVTLSEILDAHRKHLSREVKQRLLLEKEALFKEIVSPRLFPGIESFIEEAKGKNLLLGLVTGTSRNEMERILPLAMRKLFHISITGDAVKRGKPAPDPYLKALEALGLTSDEAIVIENAPYGIQSAKQAHLLCLAITTSLPREYLLGADYICNSVEEVRELFLSLTL
ncbi:MAG: HAD family hydrolase [bacterium]